MNKVILKGRLAKDIQLNTTQNGKSVAQVSIAVDKYSKDGKKEADFFNLVMWGSTAETMSKYLSKGKETLVEGRLQSRSYDDKNGNKRYITEVVVERFEFCGSKQDTPTAHPSASNNNPFGGSQQNYDEEIPF